MKVVCPHCGENSGISSSKQITGTIRELYCRLFLVVLRTHLI